ncbi:MAG: Holliday junction resolvase RecU [Bacilli bacterium]|nr:Holliday junction resolvase RecU [Bacilli bacterium]
MNYPGGIKKRQNTFEKSFVDYANRGMKLEDDLNITNKYYRDIDKAIIYKKPTPIKITKVNYLSRSNVTIKEAFFDTPSTTDYNGIYKGKYIDFEAKETTSKTAFPLSNIHLHQLKHLESIEKHGGIAFIIVKFTHLNKIFLLFEKDIKLFLENTDRKSIPISYFESNGYLIKEKFNPRIDYLEILDNIGGNNEEKN